MKGIAGFLLTGFLLGTVFAGCASQPDASSPRGAAAGETLVEEKGVTVTYEGMEMTGEGGLELTFTVKNQGEVPLILNVLDFSANRCSMAAHFASETAPGETAQDILAVYAGALEDYGLTSVEEASFSLAAFHGDTQERLWQTGPLHITL